MTRVSPSAGEARVALLPRRLKHNPYPELLADALAAEGVDAVQGEDSFGWYWRERGRVDAVHFNWLHPHYRHWRGGIFDLYATAAFTARLLFARALGHRLVWTMHNELPHDSRNRWLDRAAHAVVARLASVVGHCPEVARLAARLYGPECEVTVVPHGDFRAVYPTPPERDAALRELFLEAGAPMLLFLGQVRPYKGIELLLDAWPRVLRRHPGACLWIAGLPDPSAPRWAEEIRRRADELEGVRWEAGFVEAARCSLLLGAARAMVAPYRAFLTSGSAILAWSFERCAVVPRAGCYRRAEEDASLRLHAPGDAGDLAEAMIRSLETPDAIAREAARRRRDAHDWGVAARRLSRLYRGRVVDV